MGKRKKKATKVAAPVLVTGEDAAGASAITHEIPTKDGLALLAYISHLDASNPIVETLQSMKSFALEIFDADGNLILETEALDIGRDVASIRGFWSRCKSEFVGAIMLSKLLEAVTREALQSKVYMELLRAELVRYFEENEGASIVVHTLKTSHDDFAEVADSIVISEELLETSFDKMLADVCLGRYEYTRRELGTRSKSKRIHTEATVASKRVKR